MTGKYGYLSFMNTDRRVRNFFITDVTGFLHLPVHRLDVFIEVTDGQSLATLRTLRTLVIMNLHQILLVFNLF